MDVGTAKSVARHDHAAPRPRRAVAALLGVAGALTGCLAACGDQAEQTGDSAEAGSVWTDDAQSLLLRNDGGGLRPAPPRGSECGESQFEVTFTVATSTLTGWRCVGDGASPYRRDTLTRTLTEASLLELTEVLARLRPAPVVQGAPGCPSDGPGIFLDITSPAGTAYFRDACTGPLPSDPREPLDTRRVSEVQSALQRLAFGG
jgi:hypothetical protein